MTLKKIYISLLLIFCLSLGLFTPGISYAIDEADFEQKPSSNECGRVIVSVASTDNTSLTKEGAASFDKNIHIDDSYNFGDATDLGKNDAEKNFLSDKELRVSTISSDKYSSDELVKMLRKKAYVVSVDTDEELQKMDYTNDTFYSNMWHLNDAISYTRIPKKSNAKTPVIAVVDSGVYYTHEDLKDHIWINRHSSLPGKYGYDFGDKDADPLDNTDKSGHGTHCAGTIGAVTNNNKGITGICNSVKIMPVKIFNSYGKAYVSYFISALNYIYKAQRLGEDICAINCSIGGAHSTKTLDALIKKVGNEGALFVFAAGNNGANQDTKEKNDIMCPYEFTDKSHVIVVGASDPNGSPTPFSDFGRSSVDVFAPGDHILSTTNKNIFIPDAYPDNMRQALCSTFDSDASAIDSLYAPSELGLRNSNLQITSITSSDIDYDNKPGGTSIKVSFKHGYGSSSLILFRDVTNLNLPASANYTLSYELGTRSTNSAGAPGISWTHYTKTISFDSFYTYKGKTYLKLMTLTGTFDNKTAVLFDNISISRANVNQNSFGAYDSLSGTSMAAPVVTGCIGALACMYPNDTAIQRKERLFASVKKSPALTNYCKTGGIVNMSMFSAAKAKSSGKIKATKIELNKKKAVVKAKRKLKLKVTFYPLKTTNKKIKWYVSNKKYASVTSKGVVKTKKKGIGHTVKIYAKTKDGSKKKAYCKVRVKK